MSKIISAIECASAGRSAPGGFVHQLVRDGWGYVLGEIERARRLDIDCMLLHRPNGESFEGAIMNFDARVDLLEQGHPVCVKIINGQEDFLREVRRAWPDFRLIVYLGSSQEPDWRALARKQNFRNLLHRYADAIGPWLDAPNCDLAFDHAGRLEPRNPHGNMIKAIDSLLYPAGRTVYVEPQPQPWSLTAAMPAIMHEHWWRNWADHSRPAKRWLTGHEGLAADSPWAKEGVIDTESFVKDCLGRGDTPIVNMRELDPMFEKGGF